MNNILDSTPLGWELCPFKTPITLLLDKGAEFAKVSISRTYSHRSPSLCLRMTMLANSSEFVDCKINPVRLFYLC